MLSFAYKRFDGVVPEPGPLDAEDRALLEKVEAGFETVSDLYNARKFRAAPSVPSGLPRGNHGGQAWAKPWPWPARPQLRSNCQADAQRQPWFQIMEDRQAAATTVYVILRVVDNLKTILAPILPHTAQKLHEYLGYEGQPLGSARDRLFGTQHVIEYQEETRSHSALTYVTVARSEPGRRASYRRAMCPGSTCPCI